MFESPRARQTTNYAESIGVFVTFSWACAQGIMDKEDVMNQFEDRNVPSLDNLDVEE